MEGILPGVWRLTLGRPERFTPVRLRGRPPDAPGLRRLPGPGRFPFARGGITGRATPRGFVLFIPSGGDEQFFGLGLQLLSFNQRGRKKTLRVNSDPTADLGDSHAPVPFYVSTRGYGVLIDTARYATFHFAGTVRTASAKGGAVVVEVPVARGVDVYVFGGPDLRTAVQRYNLFSGGGCLPPRWGLGVWYRCHHQFDQRQVLRMADGLRRSRMPCDVLGLEPGWQAHAYSCSLTWSDRFPAPANMMTHLAARGFRVNLWTHAFVHPSSPVHKPLLPHSGDHRVWGGLVPDLTLPAARRILADWHERQHVRLGASGYKLDECDNSDFVKTPWSFPELSRFPSGLDGEQMHSLMGVCYQRTIEEVFHRRGQRTYGQVRSSGALAGPHPFVLYSDLYGHREFIRGLVNAGFCGLLWSPEVRHATGPEDLLRRLQTVVLSPQALINAWYIGRPPWKQWRTEANNRGRLARNWRRVEAACRRVLNLRMQLVPYLYSAFAAYRWTGLPPFRALVMDWPGDRNTWTVDDQYMIGDRLMAAPLAAGQTHRQVYLPRGTWFDFWTARRYVGPARLTVRVPLDRPCLFVRGHALLPLAEPTLHTGEPASRRLTVRIYGRGNRGMDLIEDDDLAYPTDERAGNVLALRWDARRRIGAARRTGRQDCPGYVIGNWIQVGDS